MSFNDIFMWFVSAGVVIGGVDYLLGNRLGLGQKFKEGFDCIAPMSLSMTGLIVIAPAVARIMAAVIGPAFRLVGTDPAMFGAFFSSNLGGYDLAVTLADDREIGLFGGLIAATLLGGPVSYLIPMGYGIIKEEDREYFIKGLLLGMIPVPVGCVVGGMMMGLSVGTLGANIIFICVIVVIVIIGLLFFTDKMVRAFSGFAEVIRILAIAGLMIGSIENFLGVHILEGTQPILPSMQTAASIALTLMGCLPLMEIIFRLCKNLFEKIGAFVGINGVAVGGILLSFATAIAVLKMIQDMNPKGKTVVTACMMTAMGMLTSVLGHALSVAPEIAGPQMVAKLVCGFLGMAIACAIPAGSRFYGEDSSRGKS